MRCEITKLDISYEAIFSEYALLLAEKNAALLQSLFKSINPRFPIGLQDMQAFGGTSTADLRIQLRLFNGNGRVTVTPEKLLAVFKNATSRSDIDIIKDAIKLSCNGVIGVLPDSKFRQEYIQLIGTVTLLGENPDAKTFLQGLGTQSKLRDAFPGFSGSVSGGVRTDLFDQNGGWHAHFDLQLPFLYTNEPNNLFLCISIFFNADSAFGTLDSKDEILGTLMGGFFKSVGLEQKE